MEMDDRLKKVGAIPVGGAVMTPGGTLATDFLIHVVVMSEDEPQSALTVQKALRNGLRRASDWALESLALPAIGIGVGTMEADDSARALLEILFNHLDTSPIRLYLGMAYTVGPQCGQGTGMFLLIAEATCAQYLSQLQRTFDIFLRCDG